jgi:hypothetical protein
MVMHPQIKGLQQGIKLFFDIMHHERFVQPKLVP